METVGGTQSGLLVDTQVWDGVSAWVPMTQPGGATYLTPAAPTATSVAANSGVAVATNLTRKGLILVNTSPNYISLGFGAAAVLYSGVTLNPYGGTFVMDQFTYCNVAVYAIASVASSNLGIQEF